MQQRNEKWRQTINYDNSNDAWCAAILTVTQRCDIYVQKKHLFTTVQVRCGAVRKRTAPCPLWTLQFDLISEALNATYRPNY